MRGMVMAWERGAWEKKTSQGASYTVGDSSYNENINSDSYVSEKFTGGLSFCPNCGSMMRNRYGILTCSKCGYSQESSDSSRSSPQQGGINSRQTKNQMNDVLRVMRQGKTRSQAAQILDIPLSRINHWYEHGSIGIEKHASHFYREVKYIEEDRERRRREEINRRNRETEERKRRQRLEREKRERQERLRKQNYLNKIKKQMESVVSQMKNGKTRQQAANYAGVSRSTLNDWYDKGRLGKGEPYRSFYNQIHRIETTRPKSKTNNFIKCPKCGRFYNSSKINCPHCKKDTETIKSKTSAPVNNIKKQMEEVLSLMRRGSSRNDAAEIAGVGVVTVDNWYFKGSRGDTAYTNFYNKVKNIENTRNKNKKTSIPKSTSASNYIKCPKCGKWYDKRSYSNCPHCKKSTKKSSDEVSYCINCGKKINSNSDYCSECEESLNVYNSNYKIWLILIFVLILIYIILLNIY